MPHSSQKIASTYLLRAVSFSRTANEYWDGIEEEGVYTEGEERSYWGSGGAGLLFRTPTRVLLVHRSSHVQEPGTWGTVGGALSFGEDPKRAAMREATEELGPLPSNRIIGKYLYRDGSFIYTTFISLISEEAADRWRPRLNWENTDWEWVENGEASSYRLHFGVKPVLKKIGWS